MNEWIKKIFRRKPTAREELEAVYNRALEDKGGLCKFASTDTTIEPLLCPAYRNECLDAKFKKEMCEQGIGRTDRRNLSEGGFLYTYNCEEYTKLMHKETDILMPLFFL